MYLFILIHVELFDYYMILGDVTVVLCSQKGQVNLNFICTANSIHGENHKEKFFFSTNLWKIVHISIQLE